MRTKNSPARALSSPQQSGGQMLETLYSRKLSVKQEKRKMLPWVSRRNSNDAENEFAGSVYFRKSNSLKVNDLFMLKNLRLTFDSRHSDHQID